MTTCETTDFIYPMLCDVYYPIVGQNVYGQIKKEWVFDRSIVLNAGPVGSLQENEIKAEFLVEYENMLLGRTRSDIRISSNGELYTLTNILVANIRTANNELIYKETGGQRSGRGTIYELASYEPMVGPFGSVEYFKLVIRRTENQGATD